MVALALAFASWNLGLPLTLQRPGAELAEISRLAAAGTAEQGGLLDEPPEAAS